MHQESVRGSKAEWILTQRLISRPHRHFVLGGRWFPLISNNRFLPTRAHFSIHSTLPGFHIFVLYIRSAFRQHQKTRAFASETKMPCKLSAFCSWLRERRRRFVREALNAWLEAFRPILWSSDVASGSCTFNICAWFMRGGLLITRVPSILLHG